MPPLSPEQTEKIIQDSRDSAASLLSDLKYLQRYIASSETEENFNMLPDEVTRISAILRRMFFDRILGYVSAPRMGKIEIKMPQNNPMYRMIDKSRCEFFQSAGAAVFGFLIRAFVINESGGIPNDHDAEAVVAANIEQFMAQRVFFASGTYITRRDVIDYVANICGGVHIKTIRGQTEMTLSGIRAATDIWKDGETSRISYHAEKLAVAGSEKAPFVYKPNSIDAVLLELLATVRYLIQSPDIIRLVEILDAEMSQFGGISTRPVS